MRWRIACLAAVSFVAIAASCGTEVYNFGVNHCTDGAQNSGETDVDCGGPCGPCAAGEACSAATDCESGFCTNNECEPSGCDDQVKDGDETDVDCGGPACPGCSLGDSCATGTDCESATCTNGECVLGRCANGQRDGEESDVDCGGPKCPKCADGASCLQGSDCESASCDEGACGPSPTCDDETKNGAETDVDCGGDDCEGCSIGQACDGDGDCSAGTCSLGLCCAAGTGNCDDDATNGCEADTLSDAANCGTCGTACPETGPTCSNGGCVDCGDDCWGPSGCLTNAGRCIQFTCRPAGAGADFCQRCKGLKDVSHSQWLNDGYCEDSIAKYRETEGYVAKCGSSTGCCGPADECGGNDAAWHFFNAAANRTYITGPALNNPGPAGALCTEPNYPAGLSMPGFARLTVCEH